jgi:hypothetical protein
MNLEELQGRSKGLAENIERTAQSLYILHGHKAEVDFQISELMKKENETKVDEPPVPESQSPVES